MSTWQKYLYISGTAGGGEAGALSISTGERLTTTGDIITCIYLAAKGGAEAELLVISTRIWQGTITFLYLATARGWRWGGYGLGCTGLYLL